MLDWLIDFFQQNHLIVIAGGISSIVFILGVRRRVINQYIYSKNILLVLLRLGRALACRKVVIVANAECSPDIKNVLLDSDFFTEKNITEISRWNIENLKGATLIIAHYKTVADDLPEIIGALKSNMDKRYALIVYAPTDQGRVSDEHMTLINQKRNTTLVNMRGRLLSDAFVYMMTT
ncbi:hypothetical protein [Teredinibacter turnerae]|uniref:hypothetical protein n=1 Tax=Teredinibacter turnerae TaxID=2426 RepID=UPI0003805E15|nr:hypothetical protein [Teredinibacter turnerae]